MRRALYWRANASASLKAATAGCKPARVVDIHAVQQPGLDTVFVHDAQCAADVVDEVEGHAGTGTPTIAALAQHEILRSARKLGQRPRRLFRGAQRHHVRIERSSSCAAVSGISPVCRNSVSSIPARRHATRPAPGRRRFCTPSRSGSMVQPGSTSRSNCPRLSAFQVMAPLSVDTQMPRQLSVIRRGRYLHQLGRSTSRSQSWPRGPWPMAGAGRTMTSKRCWRLQQVFDVIHDIFAHVLDMLFAGVGARQRDHFLVRPRHAPPQRRPPAPAP